MTANISLSESVGQLAEVPVSGGRSRAWMALRANPAFWIGAATMTIVVVLAIFGPILRPLPGCLYCVEGLDPKYNALGPSLAFPLGTDRMGRDYLSLLVFGARTSLVAGIGANVIATLIGVLIGATAAYAGNRSVGVRIRGHQVDVPLPISSLLMRATDVALSFPALLLALALVSVMGRSLLLVIVVIAAVLWTGMARIVYGRVLIVRELDFVEAARAVGVSRSRILFRHVLPHVLPLIVAYATLGIAGAILFEATLSFLGAGVPPSVVSWGTMIQYAAEGGWWHTYPRLFLLPGLAIMLTILAFTLLGDALRDALDPRSRR